MQRYALVLEYIGTDFSGSQKQNGQPESRTVQSELERALGIIIGRHPEADEVQRKDLKEEKYPHNDVVRTIFSGRTDRGVHSKGQVVHFDLPEEIREDKLLASLNGLLPNDISVKAICKTDNNFHSQKKAVIRWYRYSINNAKTRSVFYSVHVPFRLNVERLNKALSYLVGTNDFSAFKSANTENPARECHLYMAEASRENDIVYIDIVANRFLYNMVRIIIGTVIEMEKKNLPPEHMKNVLESKNRTTAGKTFSPDGLCLMQVGYGEGYSYINEMNGTYRREVA